MISVNEAIEIHSILIEKFGGTKGIRDIGLLESALKRPFQTFEQKNLYQSPIEMAAALIESIVKNHPFIDGSKRLGYVLMRLFLIENNVDIIANEDDKYMFVIKIAEGKLEFNKILNWIKKHIIN